jgi:dipeptidyl aminopeptidase/acylaminoacyl peptidase
MALPKNKKHKSNTRITRTIIGLVTLVFYAGLFTAAIYISVINPSKVQSGVLGPEETATVSGFSRSLDLRVAAKNSYPSDPVTVVQNLGDRDGFPSKVFSFKAKADGLTEYGMMLFPTTVQPAQGYPVIILCHGYETPAKYSTTRDAVNDMEFYARHGFAVLKPDYRGQGMSINQGRADSAYYSMNYNTDLMSLLTAVKKTDYLDKSNINLWGMSMGAYLALRATVLSPDVKNLILLSGPVASLKTMYLTYIPPSDVNNLIALKTRNEIFSKYGSPAENSTFWSAASPINFANRIKARVQIHVGSLDQVVPPQLSADLDSVL